jgi:hypothetical protein
MGKAVRTLGKVALGVGLMFVPGAGAGALIAKSIGANILLGEAARVLGPKPPKRVINPQTVTVRGNNLPGSVVYGETRTGGMLYVPAPGVSGTGNKYLHYIIVLACHELTSIGDIWLDNVLIPEASIDVDGNVTEGQFAGKLVIEKFLGTDDQTASPLLVEAFAGWDADYRGRGVAYLHLRMERDEEAFPSGPPGNVFAMVRGRKVYDPRSGVTAWSDNPALCTRDYLTTYCSSTIDDAYAIAAANICDEEVTAFGTQKRYRCSGVISTGEEPADNLAGLLSAMNGTLTFAQGKFRMYAGAFDAPTKTIDDSWLAGDVSLQATTPGAKLYNIVRGEYIDPSRNYQISEFEPQVAAAYQSIDGRELELAMQLPFTFNEYQAQRQAYQLLLQSRGQRVIELPLNLKALDIAVWETVFVDLPRLGVNEIYRVMSWTYSDAGSVVVSLREDSAGFYQEPVYIAASTSATFETPRQSPDAPNNLTIIPGSGGVQLTWTNPPSRQFDQIEIWRSPDADFANAVLIATVRASSYWDAVPTPDTWFYWIRARNSSGQFSDYIPDVADSGSGGSTTPPSNGAYSATLSASTVYKSAPNNTSATTN